MAMAVVARPRAASRRRSGTQGLSASLQRGRCASSALGMVAIPIGLRTSHLIGCARTCGHVRRRFHRHARAVDDPQRDLGLGDPLFPMIGHAEQLERFQAARVAGARARLAALGDRFAEHAVRLLVILGRRAQHSPARCGQDVATSAVAMIKVLALQLMFWLLTHQQGRFLIPLLLPCCVLIGLGVAGYATLTSLASPRRPSPCGAPPSLTIYLTEDGGQAAYFIDGVSVFGDRDPQMPVDTPYTIIAACSPPTPASSEGPATAPTSTSPWRITPSGTAARSSAALEAGGVSGGAPVAEVERFHARRSPGDAERWMSPGNYGYDPNVKPDALKAMADAVLGRWARSGP